MGLYHLRKVLAIIPQDPFLLEGTIKFNIDPFNEHSEDDIKTALGRVGIQETIRAEDIIEQRRAELKKERDSKAKKNKKKTESEEEEDNFDSDPLISRLKTSDLTVEDILNFQIESRGNNLSVGQRQLVCIARAIIGSPKILLMDEATANIDQKTDSTIQRVIKEYLKSTTVITIAHRLLTIIQYDKIIVLSNGKKMEEGTPADLIRSEGFFSDLVAEGGEKFK